MRTINLKSYPEICDKIVYELADNKITNISFYLNNKPVLQKLCTKLTGVSADKLLAGADKIIEKAPFIKDLINDITHVKTRLKIKDAIYNSQT